MSGAAWEPSEILQFLARTDAHTASELAAVLQRSRAGIQGMRRKLKRLQDLGASPQELPRLLVVNEVLMLHGGLREIRRRAGLPLVQVRNYLRRGRLTGRPHLVLEHVRRPVEKEE